MTGSGPGSGRELAIQRLVAGGDGLAFADGKAVFVPGVLPGERVRVSIRQRRRDYERASLDQIIEPSPHRVSPGCRFAGRCGGCDWLHIAYDEQLRLKSLIVSEALRRTGGIERADIPVEPSMPWQARNRVQLHRDPGGGIGYMGAHSDRVVAVDECPIAAAGLGPLFRGAAPSGPDRFTAFAAEGLLAVEGRDDDRDLSVTVCGRQVAFSVGCFFQSNLGVLEKLIPWALDGQAGGTAADLYSGVGVFGCFLAAASARVVCVESSAMSLSYARRNVSGEGHEFYPVSVEQWTTTASARTGFDTVVVDPPRAGLGQQVRDWLVRKRSARLVYVSCNPVTLARDLGALTAEAYTLEDLRLFDFYPQTSHIEAVAKLSRR